MSDESHRSITYHGVRLVVPDSFEFRGVLSATGDGCCAAQTVYTHKPTGLEFVLIPGGVGEIGSQSGDVESRPRHRVHVSPFLMSRYPVTLGVWRNIMRSEITSRPWLPKRSPIAGSDDSYPVADVSALQCEAFCQRTGLKLPSEAEWEYACRAGEPEDHVSELEQYAWFADNCEDVQPVARKKPNGFGLYDTLGNVWEWCADTWHDNYIGAPTNAKPWIDLTSVNRVTRGGSVEHAETACTPVSRTYWPPEHTGSCTGFRVKCSLEGLQDDATYATAPRLCVVPDGFEFLGERTISHNGVEYQLDWLFHLETGEELPLLPGGLYDAESLWELVERVFALFYGDVLVTETGTTHPELFNPLVARRGEIYPLLVSRFLTGEPEMRQVAAFWYGELCLAIRDADEYLPTAIPSAEVFAAALAEDNQVIRRLAVSTFRGVLEHSKPFLPALISLLQDAACCSTVLEAFRELGGCANEALPHIAELALEHEDANIRELAIETINWLSEHGAFSGHMSADARQSAIHPLLSLTSRSEFLAAVAAQALVCLGHDSTGLIPILLASLESDDSRARRTAAQCLGRIGMPSDCGIRVALEKQANDPDPSVREAVAFALRRMSA